MKTPLIAVVSFPGNNCEVESMRAIRRNDMDALYFRWNDDRSLLENVDGYFIPGGFSYEDRGRSGMVAGRDSLMDFIGTEAERGKVVIGNCNGAQILVESGLIPLGKGLRMSLARNVISSRGASLATGFLSEWVHIRVACTQDRCAASNWQGVMHLPIAHGEGRFTANDTELYNALRANDQIAFEYCDEAGNASQDPSVTPNGSAFAIAGICSLAGNVVALMPHPERADGGGPYFASVREWIVRGKKKATIGSPPPVDALGASAVPKRSPRDVEIFIDTIIVNNEERTVEQTARRIAPELRLKQWKYFSIPAEAMQAVLSDLSIFNPHKERAYIRRGRRISRWQAETKREEPLADDARARLFAGVLLLRRDVPDTGADGLGSGAQTGICYGCSDVSEDALLRRPLLEIFANPHASVLERMT